MTKNTTPKEQKITIVHDKSFNVGIIFEALCSVLTRALNESDAKTLKDVKHLIYKHIYKNDNIKRELQLYRTITEASFNDKSISSAFITEVIRNASQERENTLVKESIDAFVVDLRKYPFYTQVLDSISTSQNAPFYRNISEALYLKRNVADTTSSKSKNYYMLLEKVIEEQMTKSNFANTQEKNIVVEGKKIPTIVLKKAMRIFNERYVGKFSPAINEIIQDYLYYTKADKFRTSLLKKMKNAINEMRSLQKIDGITGVNDVAYEINECYSKLNKMNFVTSNQNDIFTMVKDVAQCVDMTNELKELCQQNQQ